MIPCSLADQELRGGDVTRWDLDPTTMAQWMGAPPDPRPPSSDQEGRLREDPDGTSDWSAWIGLSVLLPGATIESVDQTLCSWFGQHEALRSRLDLVDGQVRRRTVPAEHLAFRPTRLGEYEPEELRELLSREFHARCRPTRAPAGAIFTVAVPQGHVLHAAFDHITFDGLSAYAAVGAIAGIHAAIIRGVRLPGASSPSHVDTAALEAAVSATMTPQDERLQPWRQFLRDGSVPASPVDSGIDPAGRYEHRLIRHDVCGGDVAAMLDLTYAAAGIPTGMLWTAILMQALGDEAHVLMSTHGRPSPLWQESVGWFAGVAPLSLAMPRGTSTREWVIEGARAWQQAAPAGAVPLREVQRLLDVTVEPQIVLSIIDGSRIDGHEWWTVLESRIHLGQVPPSSQTHMWLTMLPEGVSLVARLPDAPGAAAWLDRLAGRFAQLIEREAFASVTTLQGALP